jgi:hypothetical protein
MSIVINDNISNESNFVTEHWFDYIIRIGDGNPIIPFLLSHEAAALGCVNKQTSKVVRFQREKGNIVPLWSIDENQYVTFNYRNINIKSAFQVTNISLRRVTASYAHFFHKDSFQLLNKANSYYEITFYWDLLKRSYLIDYSKNDNDSYKHFKNEFRMYREKAINKYKTKTYTYDKEEENDCSICMGKYKKNDDIRELACFHFYHKNCIDFWLREKLTCPLCIRPVVI